ncbi:MAG: ATPase, T2SS/T4P/T4SS family, partial [bacterium]|nr:ATPase, T2SS/T4P/T4SS family [bacterium]
MLGKKKKKATVSSSSGEVVLPKLDFKPKISDDKEQQGVLIACRSLEQYPQAVILAAQAIKNRADQILMDFSQQGAAVRFRVDGIWESMPAMDRPTGDGVLAIYKRLCVLNPTDRKSRQQGVLPLKYKGIDWILDFMSQGVPSGERVLIKIQPKKAVLNTLSDLGMREKMQEQLRHLLNQSEAMFLFSAAAGQGLPTTWRVGMEAADRFMRDFHSVEDKKIDEPEII